VAALGAVPGLPAEQIEAALRELVSPAVLEANLKVFSAAGVK
jgi:Pyruvate/2-oxoacid:ferredoxin oxidoreductase gamma subunit